PHRRHGMVDQTIPEHWTAEGPADESHHRLSQDGCRQLKPKCEKFWTLPPIVCAHRGGQVGSWAARSPTRYRSDRSGNVSHCGPRQGAVRASTSGALLRIKRPTRNHIRFIRLKNFPDRLLDLLDGQGISLAGLRNDLDSTNEDTELARDAPRSIQPG